MVPTIFTADINDREKVLSIVLMGFSTDPFLRWICPEADNYLLFKEGFDAFGGKALETNTTYVAEGYKGTALWLPPVSYTHLTLPTNREV